MGQIKFLLDTNILSEPIKKKPNPALLHNLEKYQGQWATSSIVWRELHFGWQRLPDSRRKEEIGQYLYRLGRSSLEIYPFDRQAAEWLGAEKGRLEKSGLTPSYVDSEIAAIAVTQRLTLVTRKTGDFKNFTELQIEDWFKEKK